MVRHERTEGGTRHQVTVSRSDRGWQVCERQDERVVRMSYYTDWHRVERAVQVFELRDRRDTSH